MNRLFSSMAWDMKLQARQKFYYACALVVIMWIAILLQISPASRGIFTSFLLFADLAITGFLFVGVQVLLEKWEGVIDALIITPQRPSEYILAKAGSLTIVSMLASLAVILSAHGIRFHYLYFFLGVLLTSLFYIFIGLVVIVRFRAFNSYIMAASLITLLLQIPLFHFFGVSSLSLFYVFPTQGSLILFKAVFNPVETWQIFYAIGYLALWTYLAYLWARKSFLSQALRSGRN